MNNRAQTKTSIYQRRAYKVECPTCHVGPKEACRTRTGNPVRLAHISRYNMSEYLRQEALYAKSHKEL